MSNNQECVRIAAPQHQWRVGALVYNHPGTCKFASRFSSAGVPTTVATKEQRTKWLALVPKEMLNALDSSNRLLEAWLCSNVQILGKARRPNAYPLDTKRTLAVGPFLLDHADIVIDAGFLRRK